MKRVVKKQLKEDELVSTVAKIVEFIKKRTRELAVAGSALLLMFAVLVVIKAIKAQQVKKESRILSQILQVDSELRANPGKAAELEKMTGEGKFSRLAYIRLAAYWFEKGDFEKTLSYLEKIPKGRKDFIYYQGQHLMARVYQEQKNLDKAIEIYKKMEEEQPEDYPRDSFLYHLAQAYGEKGEAEKALILYKKVQDEFPQTYYGFNASQELQKLETQK